MSADSARKRARKYVASSSVGFLVGVLVFATILWAIFPASFGAALLGSACFALPLILVLPSLYLQEVRHEPTSSELVARVEMRVAAFHRWLGRAVCLAIALTLLGMGLLYGWLGPVVVILCLLPISPLVLFAWRRRRRSRAA